MRCPRCEEFYKLYPLVEGVDGGGGLVHVLGPGVASSPIDCAFNLSTAVFSSDNWNCETMNRLLDIADDKELWHYCCYGIRLAVFSIPDGAAQQGFVVVSTYKRHGNVAQALVVNDSKDRYGHEPVMLTTVEAVLGAYEEK